MKDRILKAIDENRDAIISCGEYILNNPEFGYKEIKTSQRVKEEFEKLGIPYKSELAVTGVKGVIGNKDAKINVCIIGELDAVKCFEHPFANNETGAAHACGHNAQIAAMIGAAYGIVKSGVLDELNGKITFFAVPAEEYIDIEYREQLVKNGKITYMAGKQELMHLGEFDDIDMAMMIHSHALTPSLKVFVDGTSLGFESKHITYEGKAAHGSEPYNGVNALNAAMLGLMGINANRETFKDEDRIRIHPIITNGGDAVNVIPSKAVIETYVRGATTEGIEDACKKVDNAVNAGAVAIGAKCTVKNMGGYKPLHQDKMLSSVFEENALMFTDKENIYHNIDMTGSTDMGDLSEIMPVIQPTMGGFSGALHSKEFDIADKETVYISAAKILACTAYDLLKNNAQKAVEIKECFGKQK
ncbi:MAG: amidohydrolase [Clostridia bacterium]|nr:amidohydrolase [Clostridia bacterium]